MATRPVVSASLRARLGQWLFRLAPDRGRVVLQQRRIFILPTRTGLLFALALVVMLLGAINYDLSLGHALVFLLAGLGLVAMVHTFRNLVGLSLSFGHLEPVFAGDNAHLPIYLDNGRGDARRALEFSALGRDLGTWEVEGGNQSVATLALAAGQRGRFTPPRLTLASHYPLGLFRAWSYLQPATSCLVYPRPLTLPLPPRGATRRGGDPGGSHGQEDFAGLRPRQPSDSTRHIAWKAAARDDGQRPLLVKQFAGGAARELLFDWAALPADMDGETRLSALTGWVLQADALGQSYLLRLPERQLGPANGPAHRNACLQALALHGLEGAFNPDLEEDGAHGPGRA
ncbi:MAG: DUF58 domain-containing protein [Betaproteobacteria bacterium]|nr:DUF58 domain-containing protein [Betaproteobacteria bacterium]